MPDLAASPTLDRWLRLALAPNVSPKTAHRLVNALGSVDRVFESSPGDLAAALGSESPALAALNDASLDRRVTEEMRLAQSRGVGLIAYDDAAYPPALRELEAPPLVVYVMGAPARGDRLALTLVGPRKPSDYGRLMTRSLVPPVCARGVTIVSGLAFGIDAEAHAAALKCGGRTVAVLGQGLGCSLYPSSNRKMVERMISEERGALISVFPMDTQPLPSLFPQRNEIMAALGLGTLIIEAGERSGALITATQAAELGRTVMACPGDATRSTARGSNRLLAESATLVQNSDDVLRALAPELRRVGEELGLIPPQRPEAPNEAAAGLPFAPRPENHARADPLERSIHSLLEDEHRPLDFILASCARAGYSQSEIVQKLLEMELSGRLQQLPGRVYARVR